MNCDSTFNGESCILEDGHDDVEAEYPRSHESDTGRHWATSADDRYARKGKIVEGRVIISRENSPNSSDSGVSI